jgi:GNAT superfamily N-acetyltransferase
MVEALDAYALEVTRAASTDLESVALVLEEASAWLRSRRIEQWPAKFAYDWIGPAVERGETWLAYVSGELAGTLTLTTSDPAWPNDAREATYVHRLAVRRPFAGLGVVLLDWATDEARRQCHELVRLCRPTARCAATTRRSGSSPEARPPSTAPRSCASNGLSNLGRRPVDMSRADGR